MKVCISNPILLKPKCVYMPYCLKIVNKLLTLLLTKVFKHILLHQKGTEILTFTNTTIWISIFCFETPKIHTQNYWTTHFWSPPPQLKSPRFRLPFSWFSELLLLPFWDCFWCFWFTVLLFLALLVLICCSEVTCWGWFEELRLLEAIEALDLTWRNFVELLLKLFGGETEGFACDVTAGGGLLVEVGRPVDEFLW